jgi:Tfp pilus assembly ATPase PilU
MQLLDDHLWSLYDNEIVEADECVERARQPAEFQMKIEAKLRGTTVTGMLGKSGKGEEQKLADEAQG